ncbi:MAG: R3H domain-containing nucleic acid-binding protein [Spirochaetota bacterium]
MYEFTGKTEQEAIERASEKLDLNSSLFDVEVIESSGGLLRKGSVRIRVYPHSEDNWLDSADDLEEAEEWEELTQLEVWETQLRDFMGGVLQRMEQDGEVRVYKLSGDRLLLSVCDSSDPSVLIGKHGKHLEALQVILNAYLGRLHDEENEVPENLRVQLDVGDYRKRREAKLVKLAKDVAAQVESRGSSRLLEAMNPFERRVIHKTLNNWPHISTVSEGEGIYKQVRVIYREYSE